MFITAFLLISNQRSPGASTWRQNNSLVKRFAWGSLVIVAIFMPLGGAKWFKVIIWAAGVEGGGEQATKEGTNFYGGWELNHLDTMYNQLTIHA